MEETILCRPGQGEEKGGDELGKVELGQQEGGKDEHCISFSACHINAVVKTSALHPSASRSQRTRAAG